MSEDSKAAWLDEGGLDADLTGDPSPASNNIRYWMPKGNERKVIFLTEGNKAPQIWEHNVRVGGSWRNWFTCLKAAGMDCPLCNWYEKNNEFRRYKALLFTVIDTHEFEDKSGKKHSNMKRLFVCKKKTQEILRRKYLKRVEEDQGLRGAMYEIFRGNDDTSASVGEQFEFLKMVDLDTFDDTADFDYADMFKPSPEKVKEVMEQLKAGATGSSVEGTDAKVSY